MIRAMITMASVRCPITMVKAAPPISTISRGLRSWFPMRAIRRTRGPEVDVGAHRCQSGGRLGPTQPRCRGHESHPTNPAGPPIREKDPKALV